MPASSRRRSKPISTPARRSSSKAKASPKGEQQPISNSATTSGTGQKSKTGGSSRADGGRARTLDAWVVRDASPAASAPKSPVRATGIDRGRSPLRCISPDGKRDVAAGTADKVTPGSAMVIELDVHANESPDGPEPTKDTQTGTGVAASVSKISTSTTSTTTNGRKKTPTKDTPTKNIPAKNNPPPGVKGMDTFIRRGVRTPPSDSKPTPAKRGRRSSPALPSAATTEGGLASTATPAVASPPAPPALPARKNASTSRGRRPVALPQYARTPPSRELPGRKARASFSPPASPATVAVSPASKVVNRARGARGKRATASPAQSVGKGTPAQRKRRSSVEKSSIPYSATCPSSPVKDVEQAVEEGQVVNGEAGVAATDGDAKRLSSPAKNAKEAEVTEQVMNGRAGAAPTNGGAAARNPPTPSVDVQPFASVNPSVDVAQAKALAELEAAVAAEVGKLSGAIADGLDTEDGSSKHAGSMETGSGGVESLVPALVDRVTPCVRENGKVSAAGGSARKTAKKDVGASGVAASTEKLSKAAAKKAGTAIADAGSDIGAAGGKKGKGRKSSAGAQGDKGNCADPAPTVFEKGPDRTSAKNKKRAAAESEEGASSTDALSVVDATKSGGRRGNKKRKSTNTPAPNTPKIVDGDVNSQEETVGRTGCVGIGAAAGELMNVVLPASSEKKNKKRKAPTETETATAPVETAGSPQVCENRGRGRGKGRRDQKLNTGTEGKKKKDADSSRKKKKTTVVPTPPSPIAVSQEKFDRMQRIAAAGGFGWTPMPAMRVIAPPPPPPVMKSTAAVAPVTAVVTTQDVPETVAAATVTSAGGEAASRAVSTNEESVAVDDVTMPEVELETAAAMTSSPDEMVKAAPMKGKDGERTAADDKIAITDTVGFVNGAAGESMGETQAPASPTRSGVVAMEMAQEEPPSQSRAGVVMEPRAAAAAEKEDVTTDVSAPCVEIRRQSDGDQHARCSGAVPNVASTATTKENGLFTAPTPPDAATSSAVGDARAAGAAVATSSGDRTDDTAAAKRFLGTADLEIVNSASDRPEGFGDVSTTDGSEKAGEREEDDAEYDEQYMVEDGVKGRCRRCKKCWAKPGCAVGCFRCCLKAGRACETHAKQQERKRIEDALLAGGRSQNQLDGERRLAKGVFKEEAIHAIGDTATVFCFMDFSRSKSNQGTFKALDRTQRATAGRATPRPRKAKKGATAAAVSARQGSACQKGSVAPNASPGTEGPASTVNRRRRVRPALARWRRKNAEMLAAVRASCEQTGPDLLP